MDKKTSKNFIDLFCGAGGLSVGFENAGFKIAMANDIDDASIKTFRKNHPLVPFSAILVNS